MVKLGCNSGGEWQWGQEWEVDVSGVQPKPRTCKWNFAHLPAACVFQWAVNQYRPADLGLGTPALDYKSVASKAYMKKQNKTLKLNARIQGMRY